MLTAQPHQFNGCCMALSTGLIDLLAEVLPNAPALTLSVGSGTGLLEALLQSRHSCLNIEGVEVSHRVNTFLSEERFNVVTGTWATSERAADASAILFIYPRKPELVRQYVHGFANKNCHVFIWLGPKADWIDFAPAFDGLSQHEISTEAVAAYESIVICYSPGIPDSTRNVK